MPFDPLAYRDPRPSPWLIHATGVLNRHLILPHLLRIHAIHLPRADEARLRSAVHGGTAAFLAPNHPEFTTDWMLDKEIAHRISPVMGHWASYDIVNAHPLAQRFWLALNLIANAPGGGGRACSLATARAGHGVLLHPEGTATWCGVRIGPLVPGIADLAIEAAAAEVREPSGPGGAPRPVFVVPIVWKLHFLGDVAGALDREVRFISRALGIRLPADAAVEARFAALHCGILAARARRFGVAIAPPDPPRFFATQDALAGRLVAELAPRHGAPGSAPERWLHRVRRASRAAAARDPSGARRDLALAREIDRLRRFSAEVCGGTTLTQEQIAESLQQIRSSLVTRGWRNTLHNLVPVAVGPRHAHLRVARPISVDPACDRDGLVATLHARMQEGLDGLSAELAPAIDPLRRPNPFVADRGAGAAAHGTGSHGRTRVVVPRRAAAMRGRRRA